MLNTVLKQPHTVAFVLLALLTSGVSAQCVHDFDLNAFAPAGPAEHANWVVNGAGTSASQETNQFPTFFLSPQEFSAARMEGTLTVSPTSGDDDYLGLVFGVQSPEALTGASTNVDLWLIDWKSEFQTNSEEGLSLVRVNQNFDFSDADSFMPFFWNHNAGAGFQIKDTQYGTGNGWDANVTYDLVLEFSPNHILFSIDGQVVFERDDCVQPGQFGFYSFSQTGGSFGDFTWQALPAAAVPEQVCVGQDIAIDILPTACDVTPNLEANAIQGWSWGFGNGNGTTDMTMDYAYTTPGVYAVTQTLTDSEGCTQQLSSAVQVLNGPLADFSVSSGCVGEALEFTNLTDANGSVILGYAWDFESDGIVDSEEEHPVHTYSTPDAFEVTLVAATAGCSDTVQVPLAMLPSPTASFTAQQVGLTSSYLFENLSTDADAYLWDFGVENDESDTSQAIDPTYTYSDAGEYWVTLVATSQSGCSATDSLLIDAPEDRTPFFPTAFSPNADGHNDYFRPVDPNVTAMELLIFNPWGELVFVGEDVALGWDGSAKGQPAEQGNYTYRVALELLDGRSVQLAGNISLIR